MSSTSIAIAGLLLAQTFVPQTACDRRKAPAPAPADNLPIVEAFTTADGLRLGVQIVATDLDVPWAMAFAPDGRIFVTERAGRVRIVSNGQVLEQPALTLSDVVDVHGGESGLLGIAVDPQFATNRFVYLAYSGRSSDGDTVNRLVRYREVNNQLGERVVLLDNIPGSGGHAGGRVRFGPDGKLYYTVGDGNVEERAQSLSRLVGKILRINADGTVPADNPFGSPIWTWGHRNPQGIDWHPVTGEAWATEHRNIGNDELNRLQRGRNYGWPTIQAGETFPEMERPILFFTPAIAPSGMSFYSGTRMPSLRNDIFIGALALMHIVRVRLDPNDSTRVLVTERWLENRFGRIRDIVMGPDGAIYFTTTNRDDRATPAAGDDRIARIVPLQ